MHTIDFMVVGQGIAGTLISYELSKAGQSVLVIDQPGITRASHVAGAVINPFNINTGQPVTNSNIFIPQAMDTYRSVEQLTGRSVITPKPMLIFSSGKNPAPLQVSQYLEMPDPDELSAITRCFHSTETLLKLNVWQIQTDALLDAWRSRLREQHMLWEEPFHNSLLQKSPNSIVYKGVACKAIVFCEGAAVGSNPLFSGLPFTKNRGEVLLLEIPGLSSSFVYHHKVRLIPTDTKDIFWCGSNYTWRFNDLQPGTAWREETLHYLRNWLKLPVSVKNHLVAERPTTGGQEPMVGAHPDHPRIFIFNGLGTKGFSMAPFLAKQLSQTLLHPESAEPMQLVRPLSTWI